MTFREVRKTGIQLFSSIKLRTTQQAGIALPTLTKMKSFDDLGKTLCGWFPQQTQSANYIRRLLSAALHASFPS